MRKPLYHMVLIMAAGMIFSGSSIAQTPTATSPAPATPTPASSTPPAGGAAPTAKPQTGTGTSAAAGTKTPAAKTPAKTGTAGTRAPLTLKTQKDKASYAIGLNIGKSMHKDGVEVDTAILARGVKDALAGGKTLLTDEEAKTALTLLTADLRKKAEGKAQAAGVANKTEGDAFLAANKTKDGVVTLPSGLQYKIVKEGTGPKPTAADTVVCNYKGTLINNTEFDSSYKRGKPATFPVGQVIKGWTEALQLMPVGSKWQLFVPSELAYGARGASAEIGPNATLIFDVELLSIEPKAELKTTPPPAASATPPSPATPTTTTPPPR
jgi:FKBP-type peptidyl-prolyl cis-trans isomerase FklB